MHAEARPKPVELGFDVIKAHAIGLALQRLEVVFTDDFRRPVLRVVADVAHDILRQQLLSAWARDVTLFLLNSRESKAFERAMWVAASTYPSAKLAIVDSYPSLVEGSTRRRDVAIIWDGFTTMRWVDRVRSIGSMVREPALRVVGLTQREIDTDAIPGLTSRIASRPVVTPLIPERQVCPTCGVRLFVGENLGRKN